MIESFRFSLYTVSALRILNALTNALLVLLYYFCCPFGLFRRFWGVFTQERSLILISSCAVVRGMVTGRAGKLKPLAVKQKSFELERNV